MPCYDPRSQEREPIRPRYLRDDHAEYYRNALLELQAVAHHLSALLCGLCSRVAKDKPDLIARDLDLAAWWSAHKAFDDMLASRGLDSDTKTTGHTYTFSIRFTI